MKNFTTPQDEKAWIRSQVRLAQRGNEAAYLELVEFVQPRLFSFALCLTGHYTEASSLLTDIFLQGLRRMAWLETDTEPFEWFLRFLGQEFEKRRSEKSGKMEERPVVDDPQSQAFFGALQQLTERERLVLLMVERLVFITANQA